MLKKSKKIIFTLLISILSIHASYSMDTKKCENRAIEERKEAIKNASIDSALSLLTLGMTGPDAVRAAKKASNLGKLLSILEAVKTGKIDRRVKGLARQYRVRSDNFVEIMKGYLSEVCNDFFKEYKFDGIYKFVYYDTLKRNNEPKIANNSNGPNFENPFREFTPDPSWKKRGNQYQKCINDSFINHYIQFKNPENSIKILGTEAWELSADCAPRTLFSWAGSGRLRSFEYDYGRDGKPWTKNISAKFKDTNPNAIFTINSPIATFGYGDTLIRLKAHQDTRFLYVKGSANAFYACNELPQSEKNRTIIVRTKFLGSIQFLLEFMACNFNVFHSWSYGGKENYDAAIKGYNWIKEKGPKSNEYSTYFHDVKTKLPIFNAKYDEMDTSDFALKYKMAINFTRIYAGQSERIFFHPSVPKAERTRKAHYGSDKSTYWNRFSK